jgi:3-hydroxyisobutyrate dehydrogenase-like beta-hydroxyacid dehydrogenase
MRLLPRAEAVIEHDPGAAERPRERGALAALSVEKAVADLPWVMLVVPQVAAARL